MVDDLGEHGRIFSETKIKKADLETVLNDLAAGQYTKPSQIVAFNTAEGWSKDVTLDVALELLHRAERGNAFLGEIAQRFVEFHTGRTVPGTFTVRSVIWLGCVARRSVPLRHPTHHRACHKRLASSCSRRALGRDVQGSGMFPDLFQLGECL